MSRFYLHVTNGQKTYEDHTGLDLRDSTAAEAFARIVANDLRTDGGFDTYYVDVQDELGKHIAKIFVVPRH